jgi:hypothetical protein
VIHESTSIYFAFRPVLQAGRMAALPSAVPPPFLVPSPNTSRR